MIQTVTTLFQVCSEDRESLAEGSGDPPGYPGYRRVLNGLHHNDRSTLPANSRKPANPSRPNAPTAPAMMAGILPVAMSQQGGQCEQENQDKCQRSQQEDGKIDQE